MIIIKGIAGYINKLQSIARDWYYARFSRRELLEKALRKAIYNNHLYLVYQPKVCLKTGKVTGLEALVRWKPIGGAVISPKDFIPCAESTGLIIPLGRWVLRRVCKQIKAWEPTSLNKIPIAINISPIQLEKDEFFIRDLQILLRANSLVGKRLEMEITESAVMNKMDSIKESLIALKKLGVEISLDDFGAGYSSFSVLHNLPFSKLKIDQSFINAIENDPRVEDVISAIINMARALNLKVIVEGVETEEQMKFLVRIDCNEAQGYLFAPPVMEELVLEAVRKIESGVY